MNKLVPLLAIGVVTLVIGCQGSSNRPVGGVFQTWPSPNTPNASPVYQSSLGQAVQDALLRTGDPILSQVKVSTNQNLVVLSGYVKKIRQSDTAEQIARQVQGVQNVENRLIVRQ